jgi:hypothetical protein
MYSYPGKIQKISKTPMEVERSLTLQKGENDIRWLVYDRYCLGDDDGVTVGNQGCIYAFTNTAPGKVVKIGLANFERVDVLSLKKGEDHPLAGCVQGRFLFVATNTSPSTIIKIETSTMKRVGACLLLPGMLKVICAAIDSLSVSLFVPVF